MSAPRERAFGIDQSLTLMLHNLGVSKSDVLRRAGQPEDLLDRSEPVRLPTAQFFALWSAVEDAASVETFPLKVVESISPETFAPCLFAELCSPNLRVSLGRLDAYKRLTMPMSLRLSEAEGGCVVEVLWLLADTPPPASLIVAELAYIVHVARIATRQRVTPAAVETQRPLSPAEPYAAWMGVPLAVSHRNALTFRAEDMERPFLTHNAGLWNVFEGDLRRRLADLDRESTLAERVRAALLEALPSGRGTLDGVASALGLSGRTLQRRLRQEGTAFKEVLRQTRHSLARYYLTQTSLSASHIGFLLGFDDPGSFFRAYSAWTGTTPESTRRLATA